MFKLLRRSYQKIKSALGGRIRDLFSGRIDEEKLEQLEELLYQADLGVQTATELTDEVRNLLRTRSQTSVEDVVDHLKQRIEGLLSKVPEQSHQPATGPTVILVVGVNGNGKTTSVAHKVVLTDPVDIKSEYYVGCVIDRDHARPALIISPEGGVEIEEVAANTPERILTLPIGLHGKLRGYHLRRVACFMGWEGATAKQGMQIVAKLAQAFTDSDSSLLEINPLVQTPEGELWALDAKLSIDDSALFRQPDLAACYDPSQETPGEVKAKEFDLAYIALDGDIGCMVNGAGLAMATMDLIQVHGGRPANFLDVGGGASKEKVAAGFKIILSDPTVKGILVNIFGGIMNCGTIAEGIIAAVDELKLTVPLVVRMEGTHVDRGRALLEQSGLNIISATDLGDAAEKVVKAVH
jgi:succinyl-CoA synthetase beta subunit